VSADRGGEVGLTGGVLAIAPHPDDVEIGCAGLLLALHAAGRRIVLCDMTRGEMGSTGDADTRLAEAAEAARRLGLDPAARRNLGLPDGGLRDDEATGRELVKRIRELRPDVLLAPDPRDAHPDHVAAAAACGRAFFTAGLRRAHPDLGAPWRPRLLVRYPGNDPVEPSFCFDISAYVEAKEHVIRAYASQVDLTDRGHLLRGRDVLERAQVRDAWWGMQIGVRAAEPYRVDGPLPLRDAAALFGG
jgi:bacillithiol biosynthesis deacetylase BshB1